MSRCGTARRRLLDGLWQAAAVGLLSGREQQMLAMGRAMMSEPRFLLLDEHSLGLAPKLVDQVRDVMVEINKSGTGVILVEQNATMARRSSGRACSTASTRPRRPESP